MEAIIKAENINRSFPVVGGSVHILKDINITIQKKSLTVLKGRSGSGKTTLLNILSALDMPSTGSVSFEDINITQQTESKREWYRRNEMGIIFQSVSLIPIMTAYENVEFALRLAGIKKDREKRAEECLRLMGLGSRMHHMPQELSGGEQQRVAIARAIAHKPKVIFADEPTAELDTVTGLSMIKLFKELIEKEDITIVMTTHDIGHMGIADVVYEIEDGRIVTS